MKKDLPIGITDYRKLKERNLYHVDKTLMIKELLEDKGTLVTLITRPRRFGKTLNMSMISEFFDITKDSKEIFQGTKIMKSEYASEINQYPVIYITFKAASGTKEKVISRIKEQLQNVYGYYYSILEKVDMNIFEKNNYEYIIQELNNRNSRLGNVSNALLFLTNMLNKYYNKGVIVIIDEYDMPFIEAHVNGFYDDIHDDLSSILSETFKDNSYVEFGILTGIQRVAKENTLSKFNNPAVYTVADDKYSSYFGFDYHETKQLLEYYELELNDDVKAMYDGYHIGNTYVYNPWSILNYVKNHNLKPYWVNTSSNIMIKNAIRKADASFKTGFETLIENGYLDANVKMETSFYEESETSTLWGLFLNAGYLTIENEIALKADVSKKKYRVKIPNLEVVDEFKSFLAAYLEVSSVDFLDNIIESLLEENQKEFIDSFSELLLASSYHDLKSENSYHMLLFPLCLYLQNTHEVSSNPEEGEGRSDITLKAKSSKYTSYVIEFKHGKKNDDLNELAKDAIQQIIDKKYDINLTGRIIHIGLGLYSKHVAMKWIVKNSSL